MKVKMSNKFARKKLSHWKACVAWDDKGPYVPLNYFYIKKEGEEKSSLKITGIVSEIRTVKIYKRWD